MNRMKNLVKVLAVNTVCAFIPPTLLVAMNTGPIPAGHLLNTFLTSLVYANCIGGLNFATMPILWPRASALNAWLCWSIRVIAIFANTIVGSMLACLILVGLGWLPARFY